MTGCEAVETLRARRPGALFNEVFADYLASLPAVRTWRPRASRVPLRVEPPVPSDCLDRRQFLFGSLLTVAGVSGGGPRVHGIRPLAVVAR